MIQDNPGNKGTPPRRDLAGLYLGFEFALTALLGLGAGYWIGKKFHCAPAGMLLGLFGGAILGMYNLAKSLK